MSLSQSAPMTVTVARNGREIDFNVSCLSMGVAARVQAFINRLDPPTTLREAREVSQGLPEAIATEILQEARAVERDWPPQILFASQMALAALMQADGGIRELLLRILRQGAPAEPAFTEGELLEIVDTLDGRTVEAIITKAMNIDRDVAVSRDRSLMAVVGPDGVELMVRAAASLLGSDADDAKIRETTEAIASQLHAFGTVIPLEIRPEGPRVPKGPGRSGRSGRSTSGPPTPS